MADEMVAALRDVPLFAGLSGRSLKAVASGMKERRFEAGFELTSEGAGAASFWVVLEGTATVTVHGEQRGSLGPGDWYGEIALLDGGPRTATITADGPVRAAGMASWEFKPLVEEHADIAWSLLQTLAGRVRKAEAQAEA